MSTIGDPPVTNSNAERRSSYRIDDTAILQVMPVTSLEADSCPAEAFFGSDTGIFNLVRDLRSIDNDNSGILRLIGERASDVAVYLSSLNKKINTIATAIAESIISDDNDLQSIDLSEGGIGFNHDEKLEEDSYHAIRVWFDAELVGISVFIRVVACNRSIDGRYHISASFHNLTNSDRDTISKHVVQIQQQQLRENKDS